MPRFFCVFTLILIVCSNVQGVDVFIDGQEDFDRFHMAAGQKLKSISLKNLAIDEQFWEKWNGFSFDVNSLDVLSFDGCQFVEHEDFVFLIEFKPLTLKITNCGICDKDLINIMRQSDPYITEMNLSRNNLGKNDETFKAALNNIPNKGGALEKLDLSENNIRVELKTTYPSIIKIIF